MFILFDVGASKTRIAATKDKQEITEPTILKTPASFDEFVEVFAETAKQHAGDEPIERAVGGMTGSIDKTKGEMVSSPNLPDWNGRRICDELGEKLNAPVKVENDADIVGLGEAVYGAGKGYGIVGYMTVSTGVGGGRIVGGKIDRNAIGFEIGHQVINIDDTEKDPPKKTLEDFVSGTAFERRHGKDPREVHDPAVWDDLAQTLAVGIYNTSLHFSPDVMVLGGSMIDGDPCITLDLARVRYQELMQNVTSSVPELKKAELGVVNGVWGALAYLNNLK